MSDILCFQHYSRYSLMGIATIYPIAFGLPAIVPSIGSIKVQMYWLIEGAQVLSQSARIKG